ncbi:MAG: hypothetical protein JWM21_336 [Acidobacteria bacterium]|nr:hypothetical protein [Acidobacteriota bacterium]
MLYRTDRTRFASVFLLSIVFVGLALFLPGPAQRWLQPPTHAAGMTFTVINTNDTGVGSLRQAIMDAEGNSGTDTIRFTIGTGPQTITLASSLPTITDPVIVDGTTQPGFSGAPIIELNGANVAGGASGLLITAGASTVRGLVINRFNTDGIRLSTKSGNTITGNYIGTNLSGAAAAGNVTYGIEISDSANNMIGGTSTGLGNVISGNGTSAILITGNGSTGNLIQGNFIGTDVTGTVKVANGQPGNSDAVVVGGSNNRVGGTVAGARNVISGNNNNGVSLFGTGNFVQGNFVGTDPTGNAELGNFRDGIIVGGTNHVVGGTTVAARNVVSGNGGIGIDVCCGGGATGNQVQGNFIGLRADGSAALGNGVGLRIASGNANNTIGGMVAGSGNVISGNFGTGVTITQNPVSGNQVLGNFIGVDPTGTSVISNGGYGVSIDQAKDNTIGGTTVAARNVISGHTIANIAINSQLSTGNQVLGNFIGTLADGVTAAPGNSGAGVYIYNGAATNFIGNTTAGAGNVIAFNGQGGIRIDSNAGVANAVLGNSIFANGALGIDLSLDGITTNDNCDADPGPNGLQNYPVLTSATAGATNTTIAGTLNSTANTTFRVEFFANSACNGAGNGEGKTFIGFSTVTTDGSCSANINFVVPNAALTGPFITATATDPNNNTSEFSACVLDTGIGGTLQFSAANYDINEGCARILVTVTRSGGLAVPVTVDFLSSDGTAKQRSDYNVASGTLKFTSSDTTKSFSFLANDDAYVEGDEMVNLTLSSASGGASIGAQSTATVTIKDDDTTNPPTMQPIDDAQNFVCQHYHDFLSRQADASGLAYWTGQITQCGNDQSCLRTKRIDVSNAFFFEQEFQQTGAYVYRLYRASFGNNQPFPVPVADPNFPNEDKKIPGYGVFVPDRARVIGSANLAQSQLDLANAFVLRPAFIAKYPSGQTGPQFIAAILQTIQNDIGVNLSSQTNALTNLYDQGGRGAVVYRLADDNQNNPINNQAFINAEYNRAFVATQYYGYLRRSPDVAGFLFWLSQVNGCPIRNVGAQHAMVCSFITSTEYQQRFSSVISHSNGECPQNTVCSQ